MEFIDVILVVALLAFLYWIVMVSQGVYLGHRMVQWLYDRGASIYDRTKANKPEAEAAFLGNPISERLKRDIDPHHLVLDVAVGTARLPLALFGMPSYQGNVVGLDVSRKMLAEAARKTGPYRDRLALIHHPSIPLPFDSESFDAVTCIEAVELMPNWQAAVQEMVRVLRPGGCLAITNRIGPTAKLMPGQVRSTERFVAFLTSLGLVNTAPHPWKKRYFGQPYYELILAQKQGTYTPAPTQQNRWQNALRCPRCGQEGREGSVAVGSSWACSACEKTVFVEEDGVWALL